MTRRVKIDGKAILALLVPKESKGKPGVVKGSKRFDGTRPAYRLFEGLRLDIVESDTLARAIEQDRELFGSTTWAGFEILDSPTEDTT